MTDLNTITPFADDFILKEDPSMEVRGFVRKSVVKRQLDSQRDARVGDNNVRIEGSNRRIIINDGTTDRILIGYAENGF
jgi:hypothetical protein